MVTFDQLRSVDLSSLGAVATDFEQLVQKWDLSSALATDVITPLQGSGWTGPASDAAAGVLTRTRTQLDLGFDEASALARALRDAHTQFAAAQQALQAVLDDAGKQSLTVDAAGAVHWPPAVAQADKHDPDYASTYQDKAQAIAQRITAVLATATEADAAAAAALAADTGSGTSAFNSTPLGGIPEEEAKQATDLLSLGSKATDAQVAQLDQLLKDHAGDPRFTTAFYGSQDPSTFLSNYAAMAQSADYAGSAARSASVKDLEANLGLALANATNTQNQPHVTDAWEAALRKAGASHLSMYPGQPAEGQPYGYQILSNLLRTGNYDPHFLDPVAEHITQLSMANPTMWDSVVVHHAYPFQDIQFLGQDGTGFNPMSGVLDALGHSPDAATHFFHDPATHYAPDGTAQGPADPPIKYLDVLTNNGPGNLDSGSASVLMDRDSSINQHPSTGLPFPGETTALGHALEAATVGIPYDATNAALPPHTAAMSSVMSDVVSKFGHGDGPKMLSGPGALFTNLNGSLGNMTAAYIGDVQTAVVGGVAPMPSFGAPANLENGDTVKLLATLGRDPDAYGSIVQAQEAYTRAQVQDVMLHSANHHDLTAAVGNAAQPGGTVEGIMSGARANEVFQNQQVKDAAYNAKIDQKAAWGTKVWDLTGGNELGKVPGGSYVSGQIDGSIQSYADRFKSDHGGSAQDESLQDLLKAGSGGSASDSVFASAGTTLSPTDVSDLAASASSRSTAGFDHGLLMFNNGVNGGTGTGLGGPGAGSKG
ncbi:hypothetical protein P3T37_002523 [Kitasatospora sp. MAA4]|uniref:DUF6571 family protein n=1 Tax=Kitasatospora sp. MAA4 TaxID=3035093 RepID=UPI0024746C29|nr:DUF6571 family protein [Kitasatospora sp. MAA4]MDH6133129.1 hypothetical protein [Kitasatospora sp. MAA4]